MDWYPRNISAYRDDTQHLTTLEHGAYTLLLDEYYQTRKPLPDNDQALANIVKMPLLEWLAIATRIRSFFKQKKGWLHQKRANDTLNDQDRRAKNRSEKAQKAALVRHGKIKNLHATGISQATSEHDSSLLGDATKTKTETIPIRKSDSLSKKDSINQEQGAGHNVVPLKA